MKPIVVLGVFVADTAFRADRLPRIGETLLGRDFKLGPGGKGSNQAVAAARLGAAVHLITRLGRDDFARMALAIWKEAGVTPCVIETPESYTGAAFVFIDEQTGENAIIIAPGAARLIQPADLDAEAGLISRASLFMTQLEQPIPAAERGLAIARAAGVPTILNPAPGADLEDRMLALCDYVTPNESEAEALTGIKVETVEDARKAAARLIARGAGTAIVTLGEKGALLQSRERSLHVPAFPVAKVVDTTGAGDAFNGGFAVALGQGLAPEEAVRFGCAVAAISVTRPGTAVAMPSLQEAEALFGRRLAV
jgi:ribokinase